MPSDGRPSTTALLAGRSFMAELMAGDVIPRLEARRVDVLMIKGPVIARWLYGDEVRTIADLDIVVDPRQYSLAEDALRAAGFVNRYDGAAPSWAAEHADVWRALRWSLPVDLHRRIWGFGAEPFAVWERLWAEREPLVLIGGQRVWMPSLATRALLVALHAAHHRTARKPIEDLRRALRTCSHEIWHEAAGIAQELRAVPGLAAGLTLLPDGDSLRVRVGLPDVPPTVVPGPWSVPPTTVGFVRLADAQGLWNKLALLRRALVPSPAFMRLQSADVALARRGTAGLLLSYPRRWVRIARHAMSGYRGARRLGHRDLGSSREHEGTHFQ